MSHEASSLAFHIEYLKPNKCRATVRIPAHLVDSVYQETLVGQSKYIEAPGFNSGAVPVSYVEQNFRTGLIEHVQEVLFKHLVHNFFYQEIRTQKIALAGDPRVTQIVLEPCQQATFTFECSLFPAVSLQNWKYFPFKAPKRKNYKDLDRQVESFIKEEREATGRGESGRACVGDWVYFTLCLVDSQHNPLLNGHREYLWIKIGEEEADQEFRDLFLGKSVGDVLYTDKECFQEYFGDHLNTQYIMRIEINDLVHQHYFCFDSFKRHFRLKTNKEMLQKLIEVFSYRNDISQRRTTIEETFKILLTKHPVDIPNHLILRQLENVLSMVQENPDYNVYRVQQDFKEHVYQLAEKQIKEIMIIDQIAYQEDIVVTDDDMKNYLNFFKRPRMKDFVYFQLPETRVQGQEMPLSAEFLKQYCLREKTLNYIIYYLTKK